MNHYARALEIIEDGLTVNQMHKVALDYAQRHPKAFVTVSIKTGSRLRTQPSEAGMPVCRHGHTMDPRTELFDCDPCDDPARFYE